MKSIYFLLSILLLTFSSQAQYMDSFWDFPDTLEYMHLEQRECGRIDWNERHTQFSICTENEIDQYDFEKPIWTSEDGNTQVFGFYDGLSGIDLVHRLSDGSYARWIVELQLLDTADLSFTQPDTENYPELIQITYSFTFGGGMGITEENHSEIWNVRTFERIAQFSTSFYMSGHGTSVDDLVSTSNSAGYSRTVEYKEGQLIFSKSNQETFFSQEDKSNAENSFEKRNEETCTEKIYVLKKGRFIKAKE